jgi:hypothetical protein
MKLLLCRWCYDVRKLGMRKTYCKCRRVWGRYRADGAWADVSHEAEVIGLDNHTTVSTLNRGRGPIAAWLMDRHSPTVRVEWEKVHD